MKRKQLHLSTFLILSAVILAMNGYGQQKDAQKDSSFATAPQKASYAIGVNFGNSLKQIQKKRNIDSLDPETIAKGMLDRMKRMEELRIEKDHAKKIIREHFKRIQKRREKANKKKGKKFLKKKRAQEKVERTKSGLTYKVMQEGDSIKPDPWDSVRVHYKGKKIDGKTFDSSYKRNRPLEFKVNGKILDGWTEALQLMKEGAKWKLYLPPKLAYGKRGKGQKIGPYETLVFDLTLKKVIQVDSARAAQRKDKPGKGLSPAQKRRLRRKMQRKRRQKRGDR
ncbi:MAG: FKBP-type peptidyl-prolyl cis-trans isomerase [Flavobacteriales bacterium]